MRSALWAAGVVCFSVAVGADPSVQDTQQPVQSGSSGSTPEPISSAPTSPTPDQLIARHLALGNALLEQGDAIEAQAEFRAILELDATHSDALRLMTAAQRQLEAQRAKADRARARLRRAAEDLAVKFAREKASMRAREATQAQAQLARAREQQIKLLYNRGLGLYRQGEFQAAIDAFQRMVLLEPTHPLVREAQRLITRAETKQAEARARAASRLSPGHGARASVPELEAQLTAKHIEIETTLKHARIAMKEHRHDIAVGLLQRILTQDPQHREAQQLLEQAQLAQLKDQEKQLQGQVRRDEQVMVNDIVRAQVLPEPSPVKMLSVPALADAPQTMAAKLREPISFDFTDVPLGDVLDFIADGASLSIVPSPHLDLKAKRVTMKVSQLPLELALKYLAKSQALAYRVEPDAILIATAEEFSNEPMETRVFFLRSGLGPSALETSAVEPNPALPMESFKTLAEKTVPQPQGSKLVVDERSGALIVTNTNENLALVEQLLSQLDVTPVQVLIEARFVEVTMTDLNQLGLESVLTGDYGLSKDKSPGGGQSQSTILAKGGGFKFSDLARQGEGLNFTLEGVLSSLQFESVLHMLAETKKSKTLSAPRVTALNNQTATIRVVEEFNYPTRYEVSLIQFDINGDGDFDDAGETEFANVPKDFKKRDVGILLNVTPSVGKDLRTITLVLAPEVSQAGSFRDLGGGVSVPDFTSSQLTTSVVIDDGETVVLGGLMKDTTESQVTKVPVLGDLPLVGGVFRQRLASSTRKNLLIFITARLLAPRGPTT